MRVRVCAFAAPRCGSSAHSSVNTQVIPDRYAGRRHMRSASHCNCVLNTPASARSLVSRASTISSLLQQHAPSRLQAPKEVAALDSMQLSDDNVMAAITGVAELKRKMDTFSGDATDAKALRKEVMDMRAVTEFKGQLKAVSVGFLSRASKHLCSVVRNMDLFSYKPRVVRPGGLRHDACRTMPPAPNYEA